MRIKPLLAIALLAYATMVHGMSVTVQVRAAHCGLSNGKATANVQGAVWPYTYLWNNGATSSALTGLAPGTYTVTVTDADGNVANGSGVVQADPSLASPSISTSPDCSYTCSGSGGLYETNLGGTPPYTYSLPYTHGPDGNPVYAHFSGLCAGDTPLTITDATGCTVDALISVVEQDYYTFPPILGTYPACGAQANGSIALGDVSWGGSWHFIVTGPGGFDSTYVISTFPAVITGLPPGEYGVYNTAPTVCEFGIDGITVGSIPEPCGSVSGVVFNDVDGNCSQDADDIGLPLRVMTLDPGPYYAFTDSAGQFQFNTVGYGNFTVSQPLVAETQRCPATVPVDVTIDGSTPTASLTLADSSHFPLDLELLSPNATAMRPGSNWSSHVRVRNRSPYPSGPVTLTVNYDPALDPVTGGSGGLATWAFPEMPAYSAQEVVMQGTLPPGVPLGTTYSFTCSVTNTLPEFTLVNNVLEAVGTVVGSFDPNDKLGYTNATRSGTQFFVNEDAWIDYTIHFQNTGTDTAFTVVVRDTLDTDLDIASLEVLGASHAVVPSFGEGRELVFTFNQILLPDSGTDLLASQGYVAYRAKPRAGLLVGDEITNSAGIYFDFNEPVITNTVTHLVETSAAVAEVSAGRPLRLAPNPADDVLLVLDADGADAAVRVYAIDGRPVDVEGKRTAQGLELQVGTLAPGAYLIRTSTGAARFVKH